MQRDEARASSTALTSAGASFTAAMKLLYPAFALSLLLPLSTALAKAKRAGELARMCVLDTSGMGQRVIELDHRFVQVLVSALPDRFSTVDSEEQCSDHKDNDCNGEIDEGCDPTPIVWGAGEDCDACMAQECSGLHENCQGDTPCEAALACVIEAQCLDEVLGPLACICGTGVSIAECQLTASPNDYLGPCAQELYVNPTFQIRPTRGKRLAAKSFVCMTLNCLGACLENFHQTAPAQ